MPDNETGSSLKKDSVKAKYFVPGVTAVLVIAVITLCFSSAVQASFQFGDISTADDDNLEKSIVSGDLDSGSDQNSSVSEPVQYAESSIPESDKASLYQDPQWLTFWLGIPATIVAVGIIIGFLVNYKRRRKGESDKASTEEDVKPVESPVKKELTEKIWNVPRNNPHFTGREELLTELEETLNRNENVAITQPSAIHGLGGIGKTQIATEFAYRHSVDYKVGWWINSEIAADLASDYAKLSTELGLVLVAEPDQRVKIAAVKNWLETTDQKWLLVFDNAVNTSDLMDYLPNGGNGHVIITSRNTVWGNIANCIQVKTWPRPESIKFLLEITGQDDEGAAGELADELGNFPLALAQAAAYIVERGKTISGYLDLYKRNCPELLKRGKPSEFYKHTVATTWLISFKEIEKESPASVDLLNLLAFFAPEDIPLSIVPIGKEYLPEPLKDIVDDELKFDDVIEPLMRFSFITREEDFLSIHRLVQVVTRDRLSDDDRKKWAETAVKIVNNVFPNESQDVRTWDVCSLLLSHAFSVTEHAEMMEVALEETGRLLNEISQYLGGRADFTGTKYTLERSLEIFKKVLGEDHPNTATVLNNLGSVLYDMGDLAGAKEHYERALEIDEQAYGPNHPDVAIDVNNLGGVFYAMGDLAGAKKHYERALAIFKKAFGSDHPKVAIGENNLGMVLQDMGDLIGAKKHYERALEIDEKAYGPNHPNVARDVNNLGSVLKDMGDLAGAKKHFERALAIHTHFLGDDHPKTQLVRRNLESLE